MKKIITFLLSLVMCLTLFACGRTTVEPPATSGPTDNNSNSSNQNDQQQKPTTETKLPEEDKSLVAVSVPAKTENLTAEDGTVLFQYTYQSLSMVLNKPAVADKVIVDFLNRVDVSHTAAQSVADMAKTAYNGDKNWIPYVYNLTYRPTRVDHKVLSLFGNNVIFTGASHPERTCVAANYDLTSGDVLTLASIMTKDAKTDDFCKLVLDALSPRAEGDYLYENYAQTVKQRFSGDASRDESWYFTATGICFYFVPYEIAPYTSGVIHVEIPYEKLDGILYSAYLPAQRESANGSISVTDFTNVDMKKFSHIAELIVNTNGKMYMLHTDKDVHDIEISVTDPTGTYTVFAAYGLTDGDGIMVQANESLLKNMELRYISGGQIITTPITK